MPEYEWIPAAPHKAKALCGFIILFILLIVGVVLIVFASVSNIPDLYIIAGIFLVFDIVGAVFLLVQICRPAHRLNQVETDTQVPEYQINEAVRRSKISINSAQMPTEKIQVGSSMASIQGSDVLIDVKSRLGSAKDDKKSVSFFLGDNLSIA